MYALVTNNELTVRQPGVLETKLSDGALIGAPDGIWTDELAALCGFIRVTETPRPDDTGTTTWDRTIELVDGTPTVAWTERDKTPEELAPPQPSPEEQLAQLQATIGVMTETLAQLSPEDIAAATQLAVAFLANKDRLNNAVNSVASNNTAKAPVVVLNDIVQGVGAQ